MARIRPKALAVAAAAVALTLAGCAEETGGTGGGGGDDSGPIKIGAVLDITGAGASLGVPERQTLQMLVEQVNADGGVDGRQIELIIEDNQSTEDAAARAINKLISQDQVDIVLGASRTGPSLAMRPIAEDNEVPMISLAAGKQIIDGATWVFKTAQNDSVVLQNMVALAEREGWQTLGLARDASSFGEGVEETLTELGQPAGIEVIAAEKFAPDATDFTAQMVNLRDAGADANIIWGIPPAAALAQQSYRQLGIDAPVLHSHGIGNQVFLETAGDSADGLLAPLGRLLVVEQLPDEDPQKQVILEFVDAYQAEYGEPPSTFAGHAYDAFQLAINAFAEVGTDKAAVRDHLENVEGFVGISGIFTMSPEDHSGLSREALVLVTVEDGDWKLAPEQLSD
ncbi:MAG: ABC transporter substrate-binding protein [Actinomycetota bacterium]|nr:ABC transporter substrate-binding protein [Actinomycetota bacterium]